MPNISLELTDVGKATKARCVGESQRFIAFVEQYSHWRT